MTESTTIALYRVFAECSGKWATTNWMYGCDTSPHANKPLTIAWKPMKMSTI